MECSASDCSKTVHSKGMCQAHYRQEKRRERGLKPPGPKPKPGAVSHRKLSDEEKAQRAAERKAAKTHCVNDHELVEGTYYLTAKGQKVCKLCQRASYQRYKGRTVTDTPVGVPNRDKTHCPRGHAYDMHGYLKPDGSRGCRPCNIAHRKQRVYGVTPERFADMLAEQDERCAICRKTFKDARDTHIDHDHATGAVRDLLCGNCNPGLGKFLDDPALLRAAADYLDKHMGASEHA